MLEERPHVFTKCARPQQKPFVFISSDYTLTLCPALPHPFRTLWQTVLFAPFKSSARVSARLIPNSLSKSTNFYDGINWSTFRKSGVLTLRSMEAEQRLGKRECAKVTHLRGASRNGVVTSPVSCTQLIFFSTLATSQPHPSGILS